MRTFLLLVLVCVVSVSSVAQTLPSETRSKFEPTNNGFNYTRREVMIPMRDGVKLHTVILAPKGARNAPILLTRTPYDANGLTGNTNSSDLGSALYGYDNATWSPDKVSKQNETSPVTAV